MQYSQGSWDTGEEEDDDEEENKSSKHLSHVVHKDTGIKDKLSPEEMAEYAQMLLKDSTQHHDTHMAQRKAREDNVAKYEKWEEENMGKNPALNELHHALTKKEHAHHMHARIVNSDKVQERIAACKANPIHCLKKRTKENAYQGAETVGLDVNEDFKDREAVTRPQGRTRYLSSERAQGRGLS